MLRSRTRLSGLSEPKWPLLQVSRGSGGAAGAERDDPSGWRRRAAALSSVPPPLRALCDQHDVPGGPGEPAAVSLPGTLPSFPL